MADDLGLGDLGQPRRLGAAEPGGQQLVGVLLGDVELGRDERAPAGRPLSKIVARAARLQDAGAAALTGSAAGGSSRAAITPRTAGALGAPPRAEHLGRRSMSARERCSVIATSRPSASS